MPENKNGITLIALIITIIILITLTSVTIVGVKSSGLIDKTIKAAEEDARLEKMENADSNSLAEEMKDLIFNPEDDDGGYTDPRTRRNRSRRI